MSLPEGFGQQVTAFLEAGERACLRLPGEERVLCRMGIGYVCYLIVGQKIRFCHDILLEAYADLINTVTLQHFPVAFSRTAIGWQALYAAFTTIRIPAAR